MVIHLLLMPIFIRVWLLVKLAIHLLLLRVARRNKKKKATAAVSFFFFVFFFSYCCATKLSSPSSFGFAAL